MVGYQDWELMFPVKLNLHKYVFLEWNVIRHLCYQKRYKHYANMPKYCVKMSGLLKPSFTTLGYNGGKYSSCGSLGKANQSLKLQFQYQNLTSLSLLPILRYLSLTQSFSCNRKYIYIYIYISNVYWTVHHCNSRGIKNQLDVTCCLYFTYICSTCFEH